MPEEKIYQSRGAVSRKQAKKNGNLLWLALERATRPSLELNNKISRNWKCLWKIPASGKFETRWRKVFRERYVDRDVASTERKEEEKRQKEKKEREREKRRMERSWKKRSGRKFAELERNNSFPESTLLSAQRQTREKCRFPSRGGEFRPRGVKGRGRKVERRGCARVTLKN